MVNQIITLELDAPQRAQILQSNLESLRQIERSIEQSSAKTTFTVCSALIGVPIAVARLVEIGLSERLGLCVFILVISVLSILSVCGHSSHLSWLRCAIIRIEQALGMYAENIYVHPSAIETSKWPWFKGTALFHPDTQQWGTGTWTDVTYSYRIAIVLCGLGGIAVALMAT